MKKIINILSVAAVAFGTLACTDSFLTVDNPTAQPIDEYFTTPEHLAEAVVAAYDPLQWPDWAMGSYNPLHVMSDIMADQLWVGGADKTDNKTWHLMMNYEAIPTSTLAGIWTDAYSGVKRCNDVLQYITWTEGLDEQTSKSYEAQTRVLRVMYYSWLWKFYGNIPYYEKNLDAPFVCAQITADEVYENIIKDLEGAIALNALPMQCSGDQLGRITQATAYMLYAEITMYQKDETRLPTALNYMKEIISSGLYHLVSDYGTIFKEEGEWSSESIFEVNYKDDNAVRSWGNPLAAGGTVLPRLISPSAWSGSIHQNGWGFCPVRQETYDMFAANDARRAATCWDAKNDPEGTYEPRYQDTGLFLEKYIAYAENNKDHNADADLNFNNNLRVYRYSETLLNAAELVLQGYGTGDAQGWLNEVHSRATGGETVTLSLENIKQERRLEFVGEGKRYWDLVRWGDAPTVLVPDTYGYRTNSWSESKKYLPIPQSEIDATAGTAYPLKQNNY